MTSLVDFNAFQQGDPGFAAAWNEVQAQLQKEGVPDLTGAKIALADSFSQLSSQAFGSFNADPSSVIDAAKQYVIAGQTVVGAVGQVAGLVQAFTSGASPVAITQAFTGTLIGAGVALGVVSAGVGAAIVGVLGAALSLLDSSGLLGQPPTTYSICPDIVYTSKPDIAVGCVAAFGPTVVPGSPNWRTFPSKNNAGDAGWFQPPQVGFNTLWNTPWKGAKWAGGRLGEYAGQRPIDQAFSEYKTIETLPSPGVADFASGYVAAWKADKEYALNGMQCPSIAAAHGETESDAQVLLHFLRMWNRAHAGTPQVQVNPKPGGTYWENLAYALSNQVANDPVFVGGELVIHAGPQITPGVSREIIASAVIRPNVSNAANLVATAVSSKPTLAAAAAAQDANVGLLLQKAKAAQLLAQAQAIKTGNLPPPAASANPLLAAAAGGLAGGAFFGPLGAAIGAGAGYLLAK